MESRTISSESEELVLSTGHRLIPSGGPQQAEVQVVGPAGDIQLSIRLTPTGAEVSVKAARLEFCATEALSLRAPHVEIHSNDGLDIRSGGAFRIEAREVEAHTRDDIRMDGRTILLNCDECQQEEP
jgi:hypothetical protein